MSDSNKATFFPTTLVIAHGALCAVLLVGNLVLFPPWDSLFYWWLAPFDCLGLLATPLLALQPVRAWGGLLGLISGGLETIALLYLAMMTPEGSIWPPLLLALLGVLRLGSVYGVTRMAMADRPVAPQRGCAS